MQFADLGVNDVVQRQDKGSSRRLRHAINLDALAEVVPLRFAEFLPHELFEQVEHDALSFGGWRCAQVPTSVATVVA